MTYADHPDYRALLQSVILAPDDDLPRLVLADWLDDCGLEGTANRAAYIRRAWKLYTSSEAAIDDLHAAVLGWMREAAGLPQLVPAAGRL